MVATAFNPGISTQFKKRTGLMRLPVGGSLIVVCKDKKRRQLEARSRRVVLGTDPRDLKIVCRCFGCEKHGRDFSSVEDLRAAHPSAREMAEAEEAHVWAYLCEEPEDPKGAEKAEELRLEVAGLRKLRAEKVKEIAGSKDMKARLEFRSEVATIEGEIDRLENEQKKLAEHIVGLLSDRELESADDAERAA